MVANTNLPKKLPTAQEVMEKLALAEAEKASVEARKHAAAEAEKKALIDKLTKPSGVSDEEALKRVAIIIDRAVANGLTEVQVYRFPNTLCTDNGRAINQQEAGLGNNANRRPQGNVRVLGSAAPPAWLQAQSADHRLSGWRARRCRHNLEMGVSKQIRSPIRISP